MSKDDTYAEEGPCRAIKIKEFRIQPLKVTNRPFGTALRAAPREIGGHTYL